MSIWKYVQFPKLLPQSTLTTTQTEIESITTFRPEKPV